MGNEEWLKYIKIYQSGYEDEDPTYIIDIDGSYDPQHDSDVQIYLDAMKSAWSEDEATVVERIKERHDHKTIAEKVMRELDAAGIAAKILLTDDDVAKWWSEVKAEDAKKERARLAKEAREAKKAADAELRRNTLASLTPEQKRVLGIKEN